MTTGKLFPEHDNPPGLRRLQYRFGVYSSLLDALVRGVPFEQVASDGENLPVTLLAGVPITSGERPLANLNASIGLTYSLLKAWAMVGDIFSFYQERLANEGFLRTATERRSLLELARMIGYEVPPAFSASVDLSFQVLSARGSPARVQVPAGSAVNGTSDSTGEPVYFETVEDIEARANLNSLSLDTPTVLHPQSIGPKVYDIFLASGAGGLKVGFPLLLADGDPLAPGSNVSIRVMRALEPVNPGMVKVTAPPLSETEKELRRASAWTFSRQAGFFGAQSVPWPSLPDSEKAKTGTVLSGVSRLEAPAPAHVSQGLPPADVTSLAFMTDGSLVAATPAGLFRLPEGGVVWQAAPAGLAQTGVCSLLAGGGGRAYAGTASGRVLISSDNGQTWTLAPASPAGPQGRLPASPIRTMATIRSGTAGSPGATGKWVGTDAGVFRAPDTADSWTASNASLPGSSAPTATSSADLSVRQICQDPATLTIFIATNVGIYSAPAPVDPGAALRVTPAHAGLPAPAAGAAVAAAFHPTQGWSEIKTACAVFCLIVLPQSKPSTLLAGTEAGLYRSTNLGKSWTPVKLPVASGGSQPVVNCLAQETDSRGGVSIFAGTSQGVFRSSDPGAAWVPAGLEQQNILSIAAGPAAVWVGGSFTAVRGGGSQGEEWPDFGLSAGQVELDRIYPGIIAGSFGVAVQPDGKHAFFAIERVEQNSVAKFGLVRKVTTLAVNGPSLPLLDRRQADVYLSPSPVGLLETSTKPFSALAGGSLPLVLPAPKPDLPRRFVITGQRPSGALTMEVGGVYPLQPVSTAEGVGKEATAAGLKREDVQAISWDSDSQTLLAATSYGFFRLDPASLAATGLGMPEDVSPSLIFAPGPALAVYAATSTGVSRRDPATGNWSPVSGIAAPVTAIAMDDARALWLAGASGVFRIDPPGSGGMTKPPTLAGQCLPRVAVAGQAGLPVSVLLPGAPGIAGNMTAGTSQGCFVYDGAVWRFQGGFTEPVTCLLSNSAGLLAGTANGVFLMTDRWLPFGLAGLSLQSLAVDQTGTLYAVTPAGLYHRGQKDTDWVKTPLPLTGEPNDIATAPDGRLWLANSSRLLLAADEGRQTITLAVKRVGTIDLSFGSQLDLALGSAKLTSAFEKIGETVPPTALLSVVQPGLRWIAFTASDGSRLIERQDSALAVYRLPGIEVWEPGEALDSHAPASAAFHKKSRRRRFPKAKNAPPQVPPAGAPEVLESWTIQVGDQHGTVSLPPASITMQPALAVSDTVGEPVNVTGDEGTGMLSLEAPTQLYDAQTVSVSGNIAAALQSDTVADEVLGSGNAGVNFQSFALSRSPLSQTAESWLDGLSGYNLAVRVTSGQPAVPARGIRDSSVIEASGIEWNQVSTLANSGPNDRDYVVRRDETGVASIMFGDGIRGARLPTGVENVHATYAATAGASGNVAANRLLVGRRLPAGIVRWSNPLPAWGGADPESVDVTRRNAPITTLAQKRIVSDIDYEAVARQSPGMGDAILDRLWTGRGWLLHLTVAPSEEGIPDPRVLNALTVQIRSARATQEAFKVSSYSPVLFRLEAAVTTTSDADWLALQTALVGVLEDYLSYDSAAFGQPVTKSGILATIQNTAGVLGCKLDALYRSGGTRAPNNQLSPASAFWDRAHGTAVPAELLLLDGTGGITLHFTRGE